MEIEKMEDIVSYSLLSDQEYYNVYSKDLVDAVHSNKINFDAGERFIFREFKEIYLFNTSVSLSQCKSGLEALMGSVTPGKLESLVQKCCLPYVIKKGGAQEFSMNNPERYMSQVREADLHLTFGFYDHDQRSLKSLIMLLFEQEFELSLDQKGRSPLVYIDITDTPSKFAKALLADSGSTCMTYFKIGLDNTLLISTIVNAMIVPKILAKIDQYLKKRDAVIDETHKKWFKNSWAVLCAKDFNMLNFQRKVNQVYYIFGNQCKADELVDEEAEDRGHKDDQDSRSIQRQVAEVMIEDCDVAPENNLQNEKFVQRTIEDESLVQEREDADRKLALALQKEEWGYLSQESLQLLHLSQVRVVDPQYFQSQSSLLQPQDNFNVYPHCKQSQDDYVTRMYRDIAIKRSNEIFYSQLMKQQSEDNKRSSDQHNSAQNNVNCQEISQQQQDDDSSKQLLNKVKRLKLNSLCRNSRIQILDAGDYLL